MQIGGISCHQAEEVQVREVPAAVVRVVGHEAARQEGGAVRRTVVHIAVRTEDPIAVLPVSGR